MLPKQVRPLAVVLVVATVLAYLPLYRNGFVKWDDHIYITENAHVLAGLRFSGVVWAFTSFAAANWHPLTWLSHMLDCQLFGLWAPGHHLVSLLMHLVNAFLVWVVFGRLTGAWTRCFVLALWWAVHPTHVESVAWAAERKDVLSSLFGLWAMLCYVGYARQPSVRGYVAVVLLFALSLMSKPMWVTLPCLLLLLDVWPLGRLRWSAAGEQDRGALRAAGPVLEKLPLLVLVVLSSYVTVLAQREALVSVENVTPVARVQTALCAYGFYLWKTLCPVRLSFLYPHPLHWSAWAVGGSVAVLGLVSAVVWGLRQGRPALLIGWLWYLGALVPVIGLVQVGMQFAADRYTYLPSLGLLVMATLGVPAVPPGLRRAGVVAGAVVLAALVGLTMVRVTRWRDTDVLYGDALVVSPDNAIVHRMLGERLLWRGDVDGALRQIREALRLRPRFSAAHASLGMALWRKGDLPAAIKAVTVALVLEPGLKQGGEAMGTILQESRLPNQARAPYLKQVANALDQTGHRELALSYYLEAIRLDPDLAAAHNDLGAMLADMGHLRDARREFNEALRARPGWAEPRENLRVLDRQAEHRQHGLGLGQPQ